MIVLQLMVDVASNSVTDLFYLFNSLSGSTWKFRCHLSFRIFALNKKKLNRTQPFDYFCPIHSVLTFRQNSKWGTTRVPDIRIIPDVMNEFGDDDEFLYGIYIKSPLGNHQKTVANRKN
jgi:hypothetical protein